MKHILCLLGIHRYDTYTVSSVGHFYRLCTRCGHIYSGNYCSGNVWDRHTLLETLTFADELAYEDNERYISQLRDWKHLQDMKRQKDVIGYFEAKERFDRRIDNGTIRGSYASLAAGIREYLKATGQNVPENLYPIKSWTLRP